MLVNKLNTVQLCQVVDIGPQELTVPAEMSPPHPYFHK